MTKKVITPAIGSAQTIYYETNDDNTVVKFSVGGRTVTSHSKTDSFGRKVFDELQLGTDFVSRQFVYHSGNVTDEHKTNAKVKSSATTQLVSQIILSNGTTLSYGYDDEERITSVSERYIKDGIETTNTTNYTYDALGQLLTETSIVQTIDRSREEPIVETSTELVNSMEYDNYGNITKKNGKTYTYGDTTWKDLLTGFDGKTIEYDAQGNPTSYLGHTLTWEKGRQLKSYDTNTYTYNANGIRTSKTVNGVTHEYTLDGTKILREVWGNNTLIPLYDNEDSVCGIIYNDVPYYFIKNLQGDVIEIVTSIDNELVTVAKYSYDAWGVCTVTKDSAGIATINPFRYRSYYYDEETNLYYLQSRYYDAGIGRFVNSDSVYDTEILVFGNIHYYCNNNPINNVDSSGTFAITATAGTLAAAGAVNGWNPAGWILLAVAATILIVGACAIAIEIANSRTIEKTKKKSSTRILPDVKVRKQYGKPYRLAYINKYDSLIKLYKKLSFVEALAALGITGAKNDVSQRFSYNTDTSSPAEKQLKNKSQKWGLYASTQSAAKALATVFGCTESPEVHSASGMYGHYHGGYINKKTGKYAHIFHIWYGSIITY